MRHFFIISFIFLAGLPLGAQRKYIDFLKTDSTCGTFLFTGSYQYLYTGQLHSFHTCGFHPGFGVNLARFFSKKFVLGICADLDGFKGLFTQQHFPDGFVRDFNAGFVRHYSNPADSARAYAVRTAINRSPRYYFRGNYLGDLGVMISPFPQRYGGLMLVLKTGYRSYPIFGTYGNGYIADGEADDVTLDFGRTRSIELIVKPLTLLRKQSMWDNGSLAGLYFMTVSFYAEQLDLGRGNFDGMPFSEMVSPEFVSKYSGLTTYGFKIGITIY
jgi:hypothetical protein